MGAFRTRMSAIIRNHIKAYTLLCGKVLNLSIAANATMEILIFGKTSPIVKVVPRRHKTPR